MLTIGVASHHVLPHPSVPLFPAKSLMICSLLFKVGKKPQTVQKTSSYGKEKSGHSDWPADSGHIQ